MRNLILIVIIIVILVILIILNYIEFYKPGKEIDVKGDIGEFLFISYGENANIKKITDEKYLLEILETDNEINAYTNQPKHIRKDITLNDFVNLKNLWTQNIDMENTPNAFAYIRDKDKKHKIAFKLYKPNIYEKNSYDETYRTSILIEPIDDDSKNVMEYLLKVKYIDRIYLFIDNNIETAKELLKFN
jgi:hypothetical protein